MSNQVYANDTVQYPTQVNGTNINLLLDQDVRTAANPAPTFTRLSGNSSVPTISFGAGAGTTPASPFVAGTQCGGTVAFQTGTTPAINATICTVTMPFAMPTANYGIVLMPRNANAAVANVIASAVSTTEWSIASTTPALTASNPYDWNYIVIG